MENIIYIISGKAESGKNLTASILSELYGEQKKKTIIISYASYLKEYAKNILGWDGNEKNKPRTFLQNIGDEAKKIDKEFLIRRIIEDIKIYIKYFDVIVVSDARFIEEITCIKKIFNNVKTIHLIGGENTLTDEQNRHITETALDSYNSYDFEIENNKNIDDLKAKIKYIIGEVK